MTNMADEFVQLIYKRALRLEPVVADDKNRPKVLKTIWAKFDIQMLNLMDELAEPLLRMGEEK